MENDDVLTTKEVAPELLLVHTRTVVRLAKSGELPAIKVGQVFRFSRREIEALITSKNESIPIAEEGDYTQARGILPLARDNELPEVQIRRTRDE